MNDQKIVRAAIYPALGIARVGNAKEAYFFGPEAPGPHPKDPDHFRDETGAIKRQAQRFRVYGLNAQGEVVQELNAHNADIKWNVEVANTKAAWYQFHQALDIPASQGQEGGTVVTCERRNKDVEDRSQLAITPSLVKISGIHTNRSGASSEFAFDDGRFFGEDVYLGELRTDGDGQLIFLPGFGVTKPAKGHEDAPLVNFGNNPYWHDDTCDGSVGAEVSYEGQPLEVDYAWVLSAPPNYAPGVPAAVTGFDLLEDVAIQIDQDLNPAQPSFAQHIYPLLANLVNNEWVNAGFARDFGWGSPQDFRRPEMIHRLNDASDAERPLRVSVFNRFRDASYSFMQANAWPAYYGDAVTLNSSTTDPREWLAIPPAQYKWLEQWANGDFIADGEPNFDRALSPAEQADGMTFAALNETLGGPFHPGCEFTWPMRHTSMYYKPFRIKYRPTPEPDFGPVLDYKNALEEGGPLYGNRPGGLSRWMACPWQTDTSSCLSAYEAFSGEYLPTFWPARVPNDVMTEAQYQTLTDPTSSQDAQEEAFNPLNRPKWLRGIRYTDEIPAQFIYKSDTPPMEIFTHHWSQVGIIVPKPGPEKGNYPAEVWVETGRTYPVERDDIVELLPGPVLEEEYR